MNASPQKKLLIIGGNSGIGRKVMERFLDSGHTLHVTARDPSGFEPHARLLLQTFDIADRDQKLALPDSLDGDIYLPGTITLKPFHRLTDEDFAHDLEVNLLGAVRVLQQALPALKASASKSASVVLFSSVAATTGMPFHASISAAKAAVEGLARSLAAELAPKIRVNVIAPSLTNTPLAASLLSSEERIEVASKRHPLHRIGDPSEVAALVEFLIQDDSGFATGQVFSLDGGLSTVRKF